MLQFDLIWCFSTATERGIHSGKGPVQGDGE